MSSSLLGGGGGGGNGCGGGEFEICVLAAFVSIERRRRSTFVFGTFLMKAGHFLASLLGMVLVLPEL